MSNATFIGKGKEKNNRIQVTINMEEAEQFITEYEGKKYLHFNVVALKEAGKFGHTHTVTAYHPEEKEAAK